MAGSKRRWYDQSWENVKTHGSGNYNKRWYRPQGHSGPVIRKDADDVSYEAWLDNVARTQPVSP